MLDLADFAQQTSGVNAIDNQRIEEEMRIVCYDQPIYDDMRLEGDEWLGLTLSVDRTTIILTNVQPMYDQAAILIQDNDSEPIIYTIPCRVTLALNVCTFRGCGRSGGDVLPYIGGRGCGCGVCHCVQPRH